MFHQKALDLTIQIRTGKNKNRTMTDHTPKDRARQEPGFMNIVSLG
jgi:hypothetical protein